MPEPNDPLAPIRSAWRGLEAPPPERELAQEDAATRRVVRWLQLAYARATPAPAVVPVPGPGRRTRRHRVTTAAAVLLAAGAAVLGIHGSEAPAPGPPAAVAPRPRILLTAADRTVLTAGVVRLTLLHPAPPEEESR